MTTSCMKGNYNTIKNKKRIYEKFEEFANISIPKIKKVNYFKEVQPFFHYDGPPHYSISAMIELDETPEDLYNIFSDEKMSFSYSYEKPVLEKLKDKAFGEKINEFYFRDFNINDDKKYGDLIRNSSRVYWLNYWVSHYHGSRDMTFAMQIIAFYLPVYNYLYLYSDEWYPNEYNHDKVIFKASYDFSF